jgi:hypothetical protein
MGPDATMMQQMMEKMCGTGAFTPAECGRMMASMRGMKDPAAQAAPEGGARSGELGGGEEDGRPGCCCGPQSPCPPQRP